MSGLRIRSSIQKKWREPFIRCEQASSSTTAAEYLP
jgi:hypothetical protein